MSSVTPRLHSQEARRTGARQGRGRGLAFSFSVISALVLCFLGGEFIEAREREHLFEGRSLQDIGLVQQHLHAVQSGIHAMEGLYLSSEVVTPQEFDAFAASVLARHAGLVALFYMPADSVDDAPLIAWAAAHDGIRPAASELEAAFQTVPSAPPASEHVRIPPHSFDAGSDELVLLVELGADTGRIGGIVALKAVLDAAFQDQSELWTALELGTDGTPGSALANHGTPATGIESRSSTLSFGGVPLSVGASPTASFVTATKLRLTEGLLILVGLLFALFFLVSRANRERHAAATRLQVLQSALPIPWARFDGELQLVQWNESFADLLELDDPSSWGRNLEPDGLARLHSSFLGALESGTPLQLEVWRVTDAGERRSLLAIARTETAGREAALQVVWIDSTETRKLEEQLARTQKLDAVGQLAGGIAHDFNNALTAITGYSSMLLVSLDPDSPVHADVQQILAASQRASSLTSRLLALTHSSHGERVPLQLEEVVRQTVEFARSSVGSAIQIELDLPTDLPQVLGDGIQLEHLLLNLLFNARDAMPQGGVINVSARSEFIEHLDSEAIVATEQGGHVLLEVGDTGQGIAADLVQRCFEPLFTTKASGRGTGLGLSMVKTVVEAHNGGLWCISDVGVGTTMRIALPVVHGQVEPALPSTRQSGSERILVVDDQLSICQLTQRILGDLGYRVSATTSIQEALDLAEDVPFDLFLLDVLLPESTGAELAHELYELQPHAHLLFMSGFSARILEEHADLGLTHEILTKPFTGKELASKVRSAIERSHANTSADPV